MNTKQNFIQNAVTESYFHQNVQPQAALKSQNVHNQVQFVHNHLQKDHQDHQSCPEAIFVSNFGLENYFDATRFNPNQNTFAGVYNFNPDNFNYGQVWGLGSSNNGISPTFVRRRNERERLRVKCVNEGYEKLRRHLPRYMCEKRLCKVETLRCAIEYINYLEGLLDKPPSSVGSLKTNNKRDRVRQTNGGNFVRSRQAFCNKTYEPSAGKRKMLMQPSKKIFSTINS